MPRLVLHAIPGLLLCLCIAAAAMLLQAASGLAALNPIVIALLAGLGLRAGLGAQPWLAGGIGFATRPLLRLAVVLLGLQVTLWDVVGLGLPTLAVAVAVVAVAMAAALWLGRRCGVSGPMAVLLGVGTGICGASAIVAANQVARARPDEVTAALAVITLWGTVGLLLLPAIAGPLGLDSRVYGLWAGAALHEVVQAVGAAAAGGPEATQSGTVMKLARVMLLAPVVLILGWWMMRRGSSSDAGMGAVPVPWFAPGFLVMAGAVSFGVVPPAATDASRQLVPLMLCTSIAGLGLATPMSMLLRSGWQPFLLGGLLSVVVAALALAGVLVGEGL